MPIRDWEIFVPWCLWSVDPTSNKDSRWLLFLLRAIGVMPRTAAVAKRAPPRLPGRDASNKQCDTCTKKEREEKRKKERPKVLRSFLVSARESLALTPGSYLVG